MSARWIEIYDTTLRDGTQSEHISYSLEEKLEIAQRLDDLGVDYIEGGWPGSNPKDMDFFRACKRLQLRRARIAAFGSTRHARNTPEADPNLQCLVSAETPVITIFGKSWDLHVTDALRVELPVNVEMIHSSVAYLQARCDELLYDAEHYFDGLQNNREYCLQTIQAAADAGARTIVLCDTNGGSLMDWIVEGVKAAREVLGPDVRLGIHTHNDSGVALANALAAVENGCTHVQGTINGFGERCGNVDLIPTIANLVLKMGCSCHVDVSQLTALSRLCFELSNLDLRDNQPFVGRSAFAHKGGIHVSAVSRNPRCYEHVEPEKVGNERRVLISELSGRSNVLAMLGGRFDLQDHPDKLRAIVDKVQDLENEGYHFEAAVASFELLARKALGSYQPFFELAGWRVISELRGGDDDKNKKEVTEATVKVKLDGQVVLTTSEGNGPVNALDSALRQALLPFYPSLQDMHLVNYKVRIVNATATAATGARVRVLIESADGKPHGGGSVEHWTTIGVSENIIAASWIALVDSIEYKLFKERVRSRVGEASPAEAVK